MIPTRQIKSDSPFLPVQHLLSPEFEERAYDLALKIEETSAAKKKSKK